MSKAECQKRVSYKEFVEWQIWFSLEYDHPSRADYYAMAIAQKLDKLYLKGTTAPIPALKEYVLDSPKTPITKPLTQIIKEASDQARAAIKARMGLIKRK